MEGKLDEKTATKAMCLDEALRKLQLAIRAEENGRPEKMVDLALNLACKAENMAFDGRA